MEEDPPGLSKGITQLSHLALTRYPEASAAYISKQAWSGLSKGRLHLWGDREASGLHLRCSYGEQRQFSSEEGLCPPLRSQGDLRIESRALVVVVLIDLVICGALSLPLGDMQVKYCDIDRVRRMAAGS